MSIAILGIPPDFDILHELANLEETCIDWPASRNLAVQKQTIISKILQCAHWSDGVVHLFSSR